MATERPDAGCSVESGFATVVVGVADMARARRLWENTFGMTPVAGSEHAAPALARRWGLAEPAIEETICLETPGTVGGQLRLVAFSAPAEPVRAGAQAFDLCPKNLDVYVDDLPARLPALKAAGYQFPNKSFSEVTAPNGVRFREIHMHGHDEVNIVLLQLLDEPMRFTERGYAGIGALVTIVQDPEAETQFYESDFALARVAEHRLAGPEIEAMIGLPSGAELDITIVGRPGNLMGQLEVIAYRGVDGKDRYPRTRPPATGILEVEMLKGMAGNPGSRPRSPAGLAIHLKEANIR